MSNFHSSIILPVISSILVNNLCPSSVSAAQVKSFPSRFKLSIMEAVISILYTSLLDRKQLLHVVLGRLRLYLKLQREIGQN